jgi:hypothetical protein
MSAICKLSVPLMLLFALGELLAQETRVPVRGLITSDSATVEDVHIINLSSRKGSLSNSEGVFYMNVRENDTLQFSNIQFKTKTLVISEETILRGSFTVRLDLNMEVLREIFVRDPNDFMKVKDTPVVRVDSRVLDLPNANKVIISQEERKVNYYDRGGSIDKLYGLISGDKKRKKHIQQLFSEEEIVDLIRLYLTDQYFLKILEIDEKWIDRFLQSCKTEGIVHEFKTSQYQNLLDSLDKCRANFSTNP